MADKGTPIISMDHPIIQAGFKRVSDTIRQNLGGYGNVGSAELQPIVQPLASSTNGSGTSTGEFAGPQPKQGPAQTPPVAQAGGTTLPEHLKWVNDPDKLSTFLTEFNKKYPLNPTTAAPGVQNTYTTMQPPGSNYGPPTGAAKDAADYWFKYQGYPEQYAANKGSVESKGNANAWVPGSQAAGLNQVRPIAALDVGFDFKSKIPGQGNEPVFNQEAYRAAMNDPSFNSMVSSLYARKMFNLQKGDPYRAEAAYNKGPYSFQQDGSYAKGASNYVRGMFPNQWDGTMKK